MEPVVASQSLEGAPPGGLAWESLYAQHFDTVWRFLARLGVRPAELEDLAHEVFLTAFRRADVFETGRPVLPWLLGITFRLAKDLRERASSRREVLDESPGTEVAISGPTAENAVARRQAKQLLDEVLESMDLEKRAVFVLYEFDGVPVPEIARSMQIPVATAHSRLRLARQQFDAGVKRLKARVTNE